jgi:hypothetical protein
MLYETVLFGPQSRNLFTNFLILLLIRTGTVMFSFGLASDIRIILATKLIILENTVCPQHGGRGLNKI